MAGAAKVAKIHPARTRAKMVSATLTATASCVASAPEIRDGEIEHLVAAAAHHGLDHVERETLGHLEGDLGRDGEFLPVHHGIDEHRPVMSECGRDARLDVGRRPRAGCRGCRRPPPWRRNSGS